MIYDIIYQYVLEKSRLDLIHFHYIQSTPISMNLIEGLDKRRAEAKLKKINKYRVSHKIIDLVNK